MTTLERSSLVPIAPITSRWRAIAAFVKAYWEPTLWIVLGFLVVASRLFLILVRPILFTDESLYLAETFAMFDKQVMVPWAWNPGVAALNLLTYAPFQNLPLGLDYASRLATFICGLATFGLMLLLLRGMVANRHWLMGAVVVALASVPFWSIALNSSDNYYLLFALLIMVALRYAFQHPATHWSWGFTAILLAFSTSLRNDGTVVYALTTLVFLWMLWRAPASWGRRLLALCGWGVPMLIVIGLYWGIGTAGGGYHDVFYNATRAEAVSVGERTYLAFEQGEGRIKRFELQAEGKIWYIDGMALNAELYGTRAENEGNVFRAVLRNPTEWAKRVLLNFRDFYLTWQESFGTRGTLLFIGAVWGVVLLWHHRRTDALIFLLIFSPVSVYFALTYWQVRYVIMLAPLFVVLSIYALALFTQPARPAERRVALIATLISALSMWLFYYFGSTYGNPVPAYTLGVGLVFLALLMVRFLWQPVLSPRLLTVGVGVAFLCLLVGTYRTPPYAEHIENSYSNDLADYISHAYQRYPNQRVCVGFNDLEASSLLWYARQTPVPSTSDMRAEVRNGTFAKAMQDRYCELALIARAGWSDPAVSGEATAWDNTNAEILFRSDSGLVVLFRIPPPATP